MKNSSIFFKPGRPRRCTVQIVDTTEKKPKHVAKFTIYANPAKAREVIEVALIDWEKASS